jgi:hypothetical protein
MNVLIFPLAKVDSRGSMNKSMSVATLSYLFICFFCPSCELDQRSRKSPFSGHQTHSLRVVLFDTYNHFVKNVSILFGGFSH